MISNLLYVFQQGSNGQIVYSILRTSDPNNNFIVNNAGKVFLQHPLDRESLEQHQVQVLARDSGSPSHTATATMTVTVTDVNDNPPYIGHMSVEDDTPNANTNFYRKSKEYETKDIQHQFPPIVITENSPPKKLTTLSLDDPDNWTLGHGPPFKLSIDPHADAFTKSTFAVEFFPGMLKSISVTSSTSSLQ